MKNLILSRELKALRVKNGFTQKDIAEILGISETSYNKRENGSLEFTISEIKKLKNIFNLSNDDIIRIFFSDDVA